jgi:hypothetical protein
VQFHLRDFILETNGPGVGLGDCAPGFLRDPDKTNDSHNSVGSVTPLSISADILYHRFARRATGIGQVRGRFEESTGQGRQQKPQNFGGW